MSRTLLSLAGFQVILSGRFWVIAEGSTGRWPQSTGSQKIQYFDGRQLSRRGDIHIAVQIVTILFEYSLWTHASARLANRSAAFMSKLGDMAVVPVLPMFAVRSKRVAQSVDFIALPL